MHEAGKKRPRSRTKRVVESWEMSKWEAWREDAGRQSEKDDSDGWTAGRKLITDRKRVGVKTKGFRGIGRDKG